jgi:hypothetical protein
VTTPTTALAEASERELADLRLAGDDEPAARCVVSRPLRVLREAIGAATDATARSEDDDRTTDEELG